MNGSGPSLLGEGGKEEREEGKEKDFEFSMKVSIIYLEKKILH